jgi:hypothetical protein
MSSFVAPNAVPVDSDGKRSNIPSPLPRIPLPIMSLFFCANLSDRPLKLKVTAKSSVTDCTYAIYNLNPVKTGQSRSNQIKVN